MKKLRKSNDTVQDSIEAYACSCTCYGCGCYCSNDRCRCDPSRPNAMATGVVNVLEEISFSSSSNPDFDLNVNRNMG